MIFVCLLAKTTAGFALGTDGDSWRGSLNISVLESGSYTVTAKRADPEVKGIYVTTEGGKVVPFEALKSGQTLGVQVEKSRVQVKPSAVAVVL